MHHEYLIGMRRRSRIGFEKRFRRVRRRFNRGLATAVRVMEIVTDESMAKEERVINLFMTVDADELRDALAVCREHCQLGEHGMLDELLARHQHLKRYLPRFLQLPFLAQAGGAPLMDAIAFARRVHADEVKPTGERPIGFAKASAWRSAGPWRAALADESCDFRLWEIGLAFAVADALRSGDLYLAESRHHVSFWNMVHDAEQWEQKRAVAYAKMKLPTDGDQAIQRLRAELDASVRDLVSGLPTNRFAKLCNGRLEYSKREATPEPAELQQLRSAIHEHLPLVRIEELLAEVDAWCGFTRDFRPVDGYKPRVDMRYAELSAALVAHGTNLGLQTMAQSTKGITVDVLHDVTKVYLREDTFRAANRVLVNHHHSLPLSSVWGDSTRSSSDAQRFGVRGSSLAGSFYPRYFGYYDRAVSVLTHMSDQYSVFASKVISCSEREALHVLDGLLRNDTILRPQIHATDTHGFTEQLFGLCYLCGFSFMPRFKHLADQKLYRIDGSSHGEVDTIFRGIVDTDLIREQWDQLVRVASSVLDKTAPAHVLMQRLQQSPDRLARALTMLGRIVKTAYILRYASDPELRDGVHLQLNRGESRHQLALRLFFANHGVFLKGDYEEIMCKSTALALLSNAVLVWNTVRMTEIINALEATGQTVERSHLARISPLAHAHVIPSGTYHFDRGAKGKVATA
jgi:TnpA family transposase